MQDFLFTAKEKTMNKICDGDLYKNIHIQGKTFEIRYGYYEEFERSRSEPVPIYPDFIAEPIYTEDGYPFVTAMQESCELFDGNDRELGCYGCRHFHECEDLIGICESEAKKM